VAGCWLSIAPAQAQIMKLSPAAGGRRQPRPSPTTRQGEKTPMLLQAAEVHYDTNNKRVSALATCRFIIPSATVRKSAIVVVSS